MENQRFTPGDPILIENIVSYLKAKGIFDEFRHECLADVDTKSSCQNLSQRVDGYTTKFLSNETWNPDLNKNELRNKLRRHIDESGMLAVGADHVVEQVINPKIGQLFLPRIIEVVHQYLKEENEKLTKQQTFANENSSTEKTSTENIEAGSKKTPVLDPIADILSFTYSKPKSVSQATSQKSETATKKGVETSLKTEKRKDESFKSVDIKIEKKDDDNAGIVKTSDIIIKTEKKEDALPMKNIDISTKSEKVSEEISVKPEATELSNDSLTLLSKTQTDSKESIKLKKELKSEESDIPIDIHKKVQREDSKPDKRKIEDFKLNEDNTNLEDNQSKAASSISKVSSQNKPKHDSEKSKKVKTHSSPKASSHSSDQRKFKSKESFDNKTSSEKNSKSSSKTFKVTSKDSSSLNKSNTSKSVKKEKSEDNIKKHTVTHSSKSVDSSLKKSNKSSSSKKENQSTKNKYLLDSSEKQKSSNKHSSKSENLSQQSTNTEKLMKTTLQHSSSYESSQGSDQDKSCLVIGDDQKKTKYYSKHHKKENLSKKTSGKNQGNTSNSKKSLKESDYSVKKHHNEKSLKMNFQKKLKETTLTQDSAKISSRSNSFGSTSSTSDSSNISKDVLPSSSEDTNENSSKYAEKKKKTTEKDRCFTPQNLPPPPPPPPPPSDSLTIDATSSSPEEATQSSQESESEFETGDESSADSDDSCSSSALQTSDHNSGVDSSDLNEVYNILMCSSSSSEFEGFCSSPEKSKEKSNASDISVSSVHTSDLSSYEDEISAEEVSSEDLPQLDGKKVKKKLSVKEAQELLQKKVKQTSVPPQNSSDEFPLIEEKPPELSQKPPVFISSEEEISPHPRRELRRERKLNPKYASNEYTSIFNSKRTSFITKQPNQNLQKQSVNSSNVINKNNTSDFRETISKENISNEMSPKCANTAKQRYSGIMSDKKISSNSNSSTSKSVAAIVSEAKEAISSFEAEQNQSSSEYIDSNLKEIDSAVQLTLEIKNSTLKSKNNISKHLNPYGVKRKFEESEKNTNKRLCNRNSIDSNSTKKVNENEILNDEKNDKTCNSSSESKDNLHKPKANGDVLRKLSHLRKSSHSNSNRSSNKK